MGTSKNLKMKLFGAILASFALVSADQCNDRCAKMARDEQWKCVQSGRPEDVCAQYAKDKHSKCVEDNCSSNPCHERCGRYARDQQRTCIESGRPAEKCEEYARSQYSNCVADNCSYYNVDEEVEIFKMSCSEGCDKKAQAAAKNCDGDEACMIKVKKIWGNAAELANAKLDATKKLQPRKKNV